MTAVQKLKVELGARSYEIVIGSGLLAELGRRVQPLARGNSVFVVTDENVAPLYLARVEASLAVKG